MKPGIKAFNGRFEQLEERTMLAVSSLATADGNISTPGETQVLTLSVAGTQPVVLSFHVDTPNGLDPAAPRVEDSTGTEILALYVANDHAGLHESLSVVELPLGSYNVLIQGERDTIGAFSAHVYLPGDVGADGQVSISDYDRATAAWVQAQFGLNHIASQVFANRGIDTSGNLFHSGLDANMNGVIDNFDRMVAGINQADATISLDFVVNSDAPELSAMLVGDTGRSNSDGITNDLGATIVGAISDDSIITSFTASVNGSPAASLSQILEQDFSEGGAFVINLQQMETIFGGSLVNTGPHTIQFDAQDDQGNSLVPLDLLVEFDTIAPPSPTGLVLDPSRDTGTSSTDGVTNRSELIINGDAEDNAIVRVFSSLVTGSIGEVIANSPFSATTSSVPEGNQDVTTAAIDVAGNAGPPSDPLNVNVDLTPPNSPGFDLDAGSDTGTFGDQLTTNETVTLVGSTDALAGVELRRDGTLVDTTTADASGNFMFAGVTLPFGPTPFQATALDPAGNPNSFEQNFTRNDAPVVEDQTFSVDENSPNGTVVGTISVSDDNVPEGDSLVIMTANGNGAFAIDTLSRVITVADSSALNFEATPSIDFTVQLTDMGGDGSGIPGTGLSDTATITVQLNHVNDPPGIGKQSFSISENSANGTSVGFVIASDPDAGDIVTFSTSDANFDIDTNTGEITVANSAALDFESVDSLDLTVTVTDQDGLMAMATVTVNLSDVNEPPVLDDQSFFASVHSSAGTFIDTIDVDDPDAGDIFLFEVVNSNAPTGLLNVDSASGEIALLDPNLLVGNTTLTLTIRVTDMNGSGLSNEGTITIDVVPNTPPVAEDDEITTDEDTPLDVAVLADNGNGPDHDADGDPLIISNFDGTSVTGATIVMTATGELHYDPRTSDTLNSLPAGATAVDAFEYEIEDTFGDMDTAMASVIVTGVNDDPIAVDDTRSTNEDTPITFSVLADNGNGPDSDPDNGDVISVSNVDTMSDLGATVTKNADGTVTYDPRTSPTLQALTPTDTPLVDSFDYTINDLNSGVAVGTVSVVATGINDVPIAQGDVFQVIQDSIDNELTVLDNDSTDPESSETLTVTNIGPRSEGGTATAINGGQLIRYSPRPGFVGTDVFTYTASDGNSGTVDMMVTVLVIPNVPDLGAHIHANLEIFINGVRQPDPPENVGVAALSPSIDFLSPVHTHDPDGRLHIHPIANGEPTTSITLTDFFVTWRTKAGLAGNNPNAIFTDNQVLGHVLAADEVVRMYVNGVPVSERGDYILRDEDHIVISIEKRGALNAPSFTPISDLTVLDGSPLHIPLKGFDPDSQTLTFTATSSNPAVVSTFIPQNNRSLWVTIENLGQMGFELFEGRVSAITDPMIEVFQSGVVDDTILHRIINGFVFQGFDPTGTGFGHPGLLEFDDFFHIDLQHNSSGLLSMAKSGDDTNSSQVFNTDVNPNVNPNSVTILRKLDFNHSIFARQNHGENVRRQIMVVATDPSDRPLTPVRVLDVEVLEDNENAVLMLKAPEGSIGEADITVTVRDETGNEFVQTFHVTVEDDTFNGTPFLTSVPTEVVTTVGTPTVIAIEATDVEGDPIIYAAANTGFSTTILFDDEGEETGITTPGTTGFSYKGSNWSGGTVGTIGDSAVYSSGSFNYEIGNAGAEIIFDVPVELVEFFYVHDSGTTVGTATTFDEGGNVVEVINSILATSFNDPNNFVALTPASASNPIKRVTLSSGFVDNFSFTAEPLTFPIDVDTNLGIITVTPAIAGTMAVLVGARQDSSVPTDTVDTFDRQVIPITVLPANALTAADIQSTPPREEISTIEAGTEPVESAFQAALATWTEALRFVELPDIQLEVRDLGAEQLGQSTVLKTNNDGTPGSSLVTIDDDGAAVGWQTAFDQPVAADQFDLYTVLLHEIGHSLGFRQALAHDATAHLTHHDGLHLNSSVYPGDLMAHELPPGQRRLPSEVDVAILQSFYSGNAIRSIHDLILIPEVKALDQAFEHWDQ